MPYFKRMQHLHLQQAPKVPCIALSVNETLYPTVLGVGCFKISVPHEGMSVPRKRLFEVQVFSHATLVSCTLK